MGVMGVTSSHTNGSVGVTWVLPWVLPACYHLLQSVEKPPK